jgi:hypothetical protein
MAETRRGAPPDLEAVLTELDKFIKDHPEAMIEITWRVLE